MSRRCPKRDTNNFQPRLGFNWNPKTKSGGLIGLFTGGDKFVVRGGYARTHDYAFLNLALNVASSFPYIAAIKRLELRQRVHPAAGVQFTVGQDPVSSHGPSSQTTSAHSEADITNTASSCSVSSRAAWYSASAMSAPRAAVSTRRSTAIRRQPFCGNPCTTGARVDPSIGVIRLRANAADSIYHSLQTGLEKRLSNGLSAGAHYTWSKFIDEAVGYVQHLQC